jgi:hypothetical protein
MTDPEGDLIFEAYTEEQEDVREVSSEEVEKVLGKTVAYYGDIFYNYKGYYLVGQYDKEEDKINIFWDMYAPNGEKIEVEGRLDPERFKNLVDIQEG